MAHEEGSFDDVLSGDRITFLAHECQIDAGAADRGEAGKTVLFPGCSFINYAPVLLDSVYRTLRSRGIVDGVTLQCCGRILEFVPGAEDELSAFRERLMEALKASGIRRIVAACPNCCAYLEKQIEEAGLAIEVIPLPEVLEEAGCTLTLPSFAPTPLAVHDSCPDRKRGRFARALRALIPPEDRVEMLHDRTHSRCCGSKTLARGDESAARKMAVNRLDEARSVGGEGVVTACMSCASLLSACSEDMPVFHYLELLYGQRIPWRETPPMLSVRFMLDEGSPETGTYFIDRAGSVSIEP